MPSLPHPPIPVDSGSSAAYRDEVERLVERCAAQLEVPQPDLLGHGVRAPALAAQLPVVEPLQRAPRQEAAHPRRVAPQQPVEPPPLGFDQAEVALRAE